MYVSVKWSVYWVWFVELKTIHFVFLLAWLANRASGWLAGKRIDWLTDWFTIWLTDWLVDHLTGWGHPFMMSTRRGKGVRLRWMGGFSPMWTSTQKIKIRVHWRHTVFFPCKEVGIFFTRILSLDRKKWTFFCDYWYKLLIVQFK